MFHIIRWPLLVSSVELFLQRHNLKSLSQILLFAYIYAIFGLYVLVRQIVNAFEWLFACMLLVNCRSSATLKRSSPRAGAKTPTKKPVEKRKDIRRMERGCKDYGPISWTG